MKDKHQTEIEVGDKVRLLKLPIKFEIYQYELTVGRVYEVRGEGIYNNPVIGISTDNTEEGAYVQPECVELVNDKVSIKYAAQYEDGYYVWLGETSDCRTHSLNFASLYDDETDISYYHPGAKAVKVRINYEIVEDQSEGQEGK